MNRQKAFRILALSSAAFALQGCVAAVVPIAAGGLMGGSQVVGDGDRDNEQIARAPDPAPPPIAAPSPTPTPAPVEEVAVADSMPMPESEPEPEPVEEAMTTVVAVEEIEAEAEPAPQEPVPVLVASLPDEPAPPPPVADPAPEPAPEPEAVIVEAEEAPPTRVAMAETEAPVEIFAPAREPVSEPEPAPQPQPLPVPVRPSVGSSVAATLFDPLVNYASSPEFEAGREGRESAMLADATALRPERATCDSGVPTVLIDLDPEGERLSLDETLTAPSALGVKLAQLRAAGLAIAWITGEPSENEAAIRMALVRSGLDMSGNDRLVLMRDPSERKQTLRDAVAGTSCLVAIAGDTRSDFHELFDYLLNPGDANALQPLIGNGWFIIPTPLLPEGL